MCPEAADPWVAERVEGFGQVPGLVITSHSLGLHLNRQVTLANWHANCQKVPTPEGAYPRENQQLLALYWGLACACKGTVLGCQRAVVNSGTKATSESNLIKAGDKLHLR